MTPFFMYNTIHDTQKFTREDLQEEEQYLGYELEDLERYVPTVHTDPLEAIRILDEHFEQERNLSKVTAASIRFIRETILSSIQIPF